MAYLVPEVLAVPEETLWRYVEEESGLQVYRHYLEDLLRSRPHVLSPREEQILAEVGEFARAPEIIFDMLNEADMKFGTIRDESGEEVELTHGRYTRFIRSRDRRVRREAFQKLAAQYLAHKNTLAATYNASVQKDIFNAAHTQLRFGAGVGTASGQRAGKRVRAADRIGPGGVAGAAPVPAATQAGVGAG